MKKDVKEELEYIEQEATLWDIQNILKNKADLEIIKKIFPDEKQLRFLKSLVSCIIDALEYHDEDDPEAHQDIRGKINELSEKLQNHRHDVSKQFCGKAEM